MRRPRLLIRIVALLGVMGIVSSLPAYALIFSSTGDTNYNTTAPTGVLAGSGWQWQGQWKTATGIPIAPHHFITASHLGGKVGDTFLFDGVTYTTITRNASPTSDLILWEVSGTFPTYAPIYVRNDEVGKNAVLFGRGVTRGSEINVSGLGEGPLRGWRWNSNTTGGTLRWGENTILDAKDYPANDPWPANGDLLVMDFDRYDGTNPNEVTLASLDSGGGLFLKDTFDNQWKLAGVNVDAEYAFRLTATGSDMVASIFDMGGLYYDEEGDAAGPVGPDPFVYATNTVADLPSHLYSVRLSSNVGWIRGVAGVPPLNTPPVFPAVANQSARELSPFSMTFSASDGDLPAQTLTFRLESGPGGLTVSSSGLLQWTPDETQGGYSFLVSVSVSDSGYPSLGTTNQFWIEVQEDNRNPVIGAVTPPPAIETRPLFFRLTGSDPDLPANSLAFALLNGPAGLSVAADGSVRWTPDETQGGSSYPVTVTLIDNGVPPLSTTVQFEISVAELNSAPVLTEVGNPVADEFIPFSLQLNATDPDIPANNLVFELLDGPPGLTISSSGLLRWTPDDTAGGATYPVTVRVSDDGSPSLSSTGVISIRVADSPATGRTVWQIGTDSPPGTAPSLQFAEFSPQNNVNDLRPGKVTRVPEDPAYPGAELNPGADDDFYFSGNYPAGFNALTEVLRVPFDEPPIAWERAHTLGDRTNRVHFVLGSAQATSETVFRLTADLPIGGYSVGGVAQTGFSDHDFVVRFRNGVGQTTLLYSNRISRATILMLDFSAAQVAANPGGNSVELVRTGPSSAGVSYWIMYDHLRLEVLPTNAPPQIAVVENQTADEGVPLELALSASDPDGPASGLVFSLVSGPPGLTVSRGGLLSWIPKETQGGMTYPVVVAVTDSAAIPKSATTQFMVAVGDVPQLDRTVWQLGIDSPSSASNGIQWGEFSMQNQKNDPRPGQVSRLPGDPIYDANPAANPGADDDFYFGGVFPRGFNSLPSVLRVPNDEPFWAWERAHTLGDRTNRVHFLLGTPLVSATATFRLTVDLPAGSWSVGGVTQPGFGDHDFVVAFINGAGARTVLFSGRLSQATNLVLNFSAAQVSATFGANSLELIRVGPSEASTSYWIAYDHLRLESVP